MNKLSKTVIALALTATVGFSGQAFAATTTTGTTGTTATGTTTGTTATGTTTTTGTGTMGTTTGTTTGTGTTGTTGVSRYNDNMLDRMNTYTNANDPTGYGYGGNYNTYSYRTNAAATTNRGMNWGWLGLLGLFGLAGVRTRNRDEGKFAKRD